MATSYEELKKQLREQRTNSNKVGISKVENEDVSFDDYGMDEKFQKMKRLMDKIEPRLYKFVFKGTKDASIDARNGLNELRKLCIELRADILNQRHDNESDYS
jgi:archaellum component FlaC